MNAKRQARTSLIAWLILATFSIVQLFLVPVGASAQTMLTPSGAYIPTDLETGETGHAFGRHAAIEGNLIVVGAPNADGDATDDLDDSGKVYLYDQSAATPATPIHVIDNPTPAAADRFGY